MKLHPSVYISCLDISYFLSVYISLQSIFPVIMFQMNRYYFTGDWLLLQYLYYRSQHLFSDRERISETVKPTYIKNCKINMQSKRLIFILQINESDQFIGK